MRIALSGVVSRSYGADVGRRQGIHWLRRLARTGKPKMGWKIKTAVGRGQDGRTLFTADRAWRNLSCKELPLVQKGGAETLVCGGNPHCASVRVTARPKSCSWFCRLVMIYCHGGGHRSDRHCPFACIGGAPVGAVPINSWGILSDTGVNGG